MRFLNVLNKNKYKIFIIVIFFLTINIIYNKSKTDYELVDYKIKNKIYLDRKYIDTSKSKSLQNKKLLKINRHNTKSIWILSNKQIIVLRPTCLKNEHAHYSDWENSKKNINIEGISCVHNKIYHKKFKSFIFKLVSGGPVASDPIFLDLVDKKTKIVILNKKD